MIALLSGPKSDLKPLGRISSPNLPAMLFARLKRLMTGSLRFARPRHDAEAARLAQQAVRLRDATHQGKDLCIETERQAALHLGCVRPSPRAAAVADALVGDVTEADTIDDEAREEAQIEVVRVHLQTVPRKQRRERLLVVA